MKKSFLFQTIFVILLMVINTFVHAIEKRDISDVTTDEITKDTQFTLEGSGDSHAAFVWWIPLEFWKSILARDLSTPTADKDMMIKAMSGISLMAVVQADVSRLGTFDFYAKEEVEGKMNLVLVTKDGKKQKLIPMTEVSRELQSILAIFKPMLAQSMGSLGQNVHFYVLSDDSKPSGRLIDPYQEGKIEVKLTRRDGKDLHATIEFPLNSLYVPRQCPNGKEAHISWKYCPWDGSKLKD